MSIDTDTKPRAKSGPKKADNGLPWPGLTFSDERVLMAVMKHGTVEAAADALGKTRRATDGAMSRARAAMGGMNTIQAVLAYQRFRLTGSAS